MNRVDFLNDIPPDFIWEEENEETIFYKQLEDRFTPSLGETPISFQGRETYCNTLHSYLTALIEGNSLGKTPVILGPIGIGKTTLLKWVETHAKDQIILGENLKIVSISGSTLRSSADVRRLFSRNIEGEVWKQCWRDFKDKHKLNLLEERRRWESSDPYRTVGYGRLEPVIVVDNAIIKQFQKMPNLIIIDDAHELCVETFISLWKQINHLKKSGANLLFLLSGSYGLNNLIGRIGTNHFDILELQLLVDSEIRAVIQDTLRIARFRISDEALKIVVEESLGLPILVQIWGALVWSEIRYQRKEKFVEEDVAEIQKSVLYQLHKISGYKKLRKKSRVMLRGIEKHLDKEKEISEKALSELVEKLGERIGLNDRLSMDRFEELLDADIVVKCQPGGSYREAFPHRIQLALNRKFTLQS